MRHRYYIITLLLAVFALLPISSWAQFNWPYTIQDGTIVTEVPVRPAGQQSALGRCQCGPPGSSRRWGSRWTRYRS